MHRLNHSALRSVTGLGLLAGLLYLPMAGAAGPGPGLALTWAVIAGLLVLLSPRFGTALGGLVTLAALGLALLKGADLGVAAAYDRRFNPAADLGLIPAAWHLASGTFGPGLAVLALLAGGAAMLLLAVLMFWGLGGPARLPRTARYGLALACGLIVLAYGLGRTLAPEPTGPLHVLTRVRAQNVRYVVDHLRQIRRTRARLAVFRQALSTDPLADLPTERLFSALAGHDVMVIFVESYGRSALTDPQYADTVGPVLSQIQSALHAHGAQAASAWLRSPTMGGMSWLAHGALLSGLWTDSQTRYDAMIESDRASLNRLFRRAGWTTIAAMPAITMAWPEAAWFGYDAIYGADDLGYAGKPFNWVTMPDQYTLTAIHRRVARAQRPAMVETALISSHAPWTPIPHPVPWNAVGNGTIFNPQTERGDSPAEVWSDPARVRQQYEKAIDYSLTVIGQYMVRFGRNTVFIVLGDHQPAPIITGENASRDVPIHIVTDDPALLSRLDARYWRPGMQPGAQRPDRPMSVFRESFTRAMSTP